MKVAVIMGSTSDWDVMKAAVETLEELVKSMVWRKFCSVSPGKPTIISAVN